MCSLQAAGHLATGKGIRATVPPTENWASFFGGNRRRPRSPGHFRSGGTSTDMRKPKERRNNAWRKREQVPRWQ